MIRKILLTVLLLCGVSFAQWDSYYGSNGVPLWGTYDGPAQLPVAGFYTDPSATPSTGAVVSVSTAGALTSALASAACGQTIKLQAGNSFSGNFTVPALGNCLSNYFTIETSALSSLPPYGTTTSPCYSGVTSLPGRPTFNCPGTPGTYTAQIITPNSTAALTFTAGTSGVRIMGIEFTRAVASAITYVLIQDTAGNIDHVIYDRIWCHGDEQNGSGGGDETETCVSTNAVSYFAFIGSYANDFYCVAVYGTCTEAHVIIGGLNTVNSTVESVHKIVGNFMEAAAETMIYGGGASNTVPNDVEIRLNTFWKPAQWDPNESSYNGGVRIASNPAEPVGVKNLFELKNINRALLEGIQAFNNWGGFSQDGHAFLISAKNQDISNVGVCPLCAVTNLTVRYSTVNKACSAFDVAMAPNSASPIEWAAAQNNISEHDLVADDIADPIISSGGSYSCSSGTEQVNALSPAVEPLISSSQILYNVSINHVTVVINGSAPYTPVAAIGISGGLASNSLEQYGMTFTNNVMLTGSQGTSNHADGCSSSPVTNCYCGATTPQAGTNAINACWKGPSGSGTYTFGGNCFIGTPIQSWPGTNVTSVATQNAAYTTFNNGNGGNYVIASGSACKGAATDGRDPGANISLVAAVIAGQPVFAIPAFVGGILQ